MIKPCFYSDCNWLRSKNPKENTRDQVSCPAEQKDTYLQNSDFLEEKGRKRGWKRRGWGREEEQGYLCSFLFGDFEKEPLFPKPKQSFPCKRQWSHVVCQLCRTDCAARGPFFLLLNKTKPVSGPGIMRAANNYWTSAKGQLLCQVIYTYYRIYFSQPHEQEVQIYPFYRWESWGMEMFICPIRLCSWWKVEEQGFTLRAVSLLSCGLPWWLRG